MAKNNKKAKQQPPNEKIEALKEIRRHWERYSHRRDQVTKDFAAALRAAIPITDAELAASETTLKIEADVFSGQYGSIKLCVAKHGITNELLYFLWDGTLHRNVEGVMMLTTTQLVEWLTHHVRPKS
jgi:hypothetical protein